MVDNSSFLRIAIISSFGKGKSIPNVTFVETWIKEDEVHDKSVLYGFNEPVGTLYGLMKVNNDEIWNDYVKTGKVKGFSIDLGTEPKAA